MNIVVAGVDPEIDYVPIYRVMVYFWILFGMAFMATVVSLISDFFKKTGQKVWIHSKLVKHIEKKGDVKMSLLNLDRRTIKFLPPDGNKASRKT